MAKPTCLYYGPKWDHRLAYAASIIIPTYFDYRDWHTYEDDFKPDVIISFLSDKILKGDILKIPNINFHPAPPKYPGRGGASYALFNGDIEFGATAHQMVEKIDAGQIYGSNKFRIRDTDTCESLFEQAENACLLLLTQFCMEYNANRRMPKGLLDLKWSGPAKTKKDFQEFLMIKDITAEDLALSPTIAKAKKEKEIKRKIKACAHSRFPGPYIEVYGHKFELSKDDTQR